MRSLSRASAGARVSRVANGAFWLALGGVSAFLAGLCAFYLLSGRVPFPGSVFLLGYYFIFGWAVTHAAWQAGKE